MIKEMKLFVKEVLIPTIKMLFYNSVCKSWITLVGTSDTRKLKYKLSICLIFKDEAKFLAEWIDFHITVGVDHFYLYNNNSSDNYLEVLAPYMDKGFITLIEFPYEQAQFKAYKHCYENFRNESNWISFLDADEFICPKNEISIVDWLQQYGKYPAVTIQWLMFGTGGQLYHDTKKWVIEQYTTCWDHFYKHGKCVMNTRFDVANFNTWHVHHHTYMFYRVAGVKMTIPAINQFGYICTVDKIWGGGRDKLKKSSIQINHYFTKAWDIYSAKMKKTDVLFTNNPKQDFSYFYRMEDKCITQNHTIFRFLIRMIQGNERNTMGQLKSSITE